MEKIISKILPMFEKANKILKENNINFEEKSGIANIVTITDKKLDELIKTTLQTEFPDSQIISEESSDNVKITNNNGLKFIVDPLDGTTNFTNGWPHVISIGIVENNNIIGGIIYEALNELIYFSISGRGVFVCNVHDISNYKKIIKPQYKKENIKKAVIGYDNTYGKEAFEQTKELMSKLYYEGASLKIVAPMALDLLKVALGKENRPSDYYDAIWHVEVRSWDLCAATSMLRELGGEIIGIDGNPLSIEKLTSPTDKIFFIASGNKNLISNMYKLLI